MYPLFLKELIGEAFHWIHRSYYLHGHGVRNWPTAKIQGFEDSLSDSLVDMNGSQVRNIKIK